MYASVMKETVVLSGDRVCPYLENHYTTVDSLHTGTGQGYFKQTCTLYLCP